MKKGSLLVKQLPIWKIFTLIGSKWVELLSLLLGQAVQQNTPGDVVKVLSKRTPVRLSWTKWRRLCGCEVGTVWRVDPFDTLARTVRSWSWCTDAPTRNSHGFARNWVKGLWKSWSYGRTRLRCANSQSAKHKVLIFARIWRPHRFWFRSNSPCTIIWRILRLRAELLGMHPGSSYASRIRSVNAHLGWTNALCGHMGIRLGEWNPMLTLTRFRTTNSIKVVLLARLKHNPDIAIQWIHPGQDDERIELGKCWCSFIRCCLEEFTSSDPSLKQKQPTIWEHIFAISTRGCL